MNMRLLVAFLALLIMSGCNRSMAQALHYEPAVVQLSGRLVVEDHYGPPNFGETPSIDKKEKVPILELDPPISVSSDEGANSDSFSNVRRIQLLNSPVLKLGDLAGHHVSLRGTLSENQSGGNYADVMMSVQEIIPAE